MLLLTITLNMLCQINTDPKQKAPAAYKGPLKKYVTGLGGRGVKQNGGKEWQGGRGFKQNSDVTAY